MLPPADEPIAIFDPVEFELASARHPIAILLLPVVLLKSAQYP